MTQRKSKDSCRGRLNADGKELRIVTFVQRSREIKIGEELFDKSKFYFDLSNISSESPI